MLPLAAALLLTSTLVQGGTLVPAPAREVSPGDDAAERGPTGAAVSPPRPIGLVTLSANAGGFAAVGENRAGFAAGGTVEWNASSAWGIALRGNYDSPVTATVRQGAVTTALGYAGLLGRVRFVGESTAFDVLAGPAWSALMVSTGGYPVNVQRTFKDLGLVTTLRLRQRLVGPVALLAEGTLVVRAHQDAIVVGGPDAVRVPPAHLGVSAGVAVDLF